jgi:RimJ/RimL family protein N-acetyltransferase
MMVKLISVYAIEEISISFLYDLLGERTPSESISHKQMPNYTLHMEFVRSHPYFAWYLIQDDDERFVGSIYLTERREIGIHIRRQHCRKGYGTMALGELMDKHPGKFLANISPENGPSAQFFLENGFHKIQETYALD